MATFNWSQEIGAGGPAIWKAAGNIRIYVDGEYKMALAYIYTGSEWKPVIPYIKTSTDWKIIAG